MSEFDPVAKLAQQFLIQGNKALAQKVFEKAEIFEVSKGKTLFVEGEPEDDLYLILTGEFGVFFQGAQIATRAAGIHVGEMAVVDPGSDRSATIAALQASSVAKISHIDFASLADEFPILWRGIAVELAGRNRSLNEYISCQEPEPEMPILDQKVDESDQG